MGERCINQENIEKKSKLTFYALFALIMLLLFLKYALLVSIPSMLLVALFAVIIFFGDQDEILAICICCIPLSTALPCYYVVTCCTVVYLLKHRTNIRIDSGLMPILLLVVWELLHCFKHNAAVFSLMVQFIPYIFFVILFFSLALTLLVFSRICLACSSYFSCPSRMIKGS